MASARLQRRGRPRSGNGCRRCGCGSRRHPPAPSAWAPRPRPTRAPRLPQGRPRSPRHDGHRSHPLQQKLGVRPRSSCVLASRVPRLARSAPPREGEHHAGSGLPRHHLLRNVGFLPGAPLRTLTIIIWCSGRASDSKPPGSSSFPAGGSPLRRRSPDATAEIAELAGPADPARVGASSTRSGLRSRATESGTWPLASKSW